MYYLYLVTFFASVYSRPCHDFLQVAESGETTGLFSNSTSNHSSPPSCPSTLDLITQLDRKSRDGPLFISGPQVLHGKCKLRWLDKDNMCQMLSSPATNIILIGDSVTRHLAHALQMILRGNWALGALISNLTEDVKRKCGCENQYTEKLCRSYILKDTDNTSALPVSPCPPARILYFGATEAEDFDLQYAQLLKVISQGSRPRTIILLGGWGFHNSLNAKEVYSNLVLKVHRATLLKRSSIHLVCLGVHTLQDNHPEQYFNLQNNPRAIRYNTLLKRLCRELSVPFFDTWHLTKRAKSYDGMHYGLAVNLIKAQLIMNHIAELVDVDS